MYRPIFRPQWPDPTTTLDWKNCTMASGAMALDFHTLGKVQKWGGELRKLSGDTVGGTGITELKRAWTRLGYTLDDQRGKPWSVVMSSLRAGKGVVLQGDYDVLTGNDTCQGSFDGDHAIYLTPEFYRSPTRGLCILVGDPLCKIYKWIPETVLLAYAAKLGKAQYGDANKLFFATTRAHPDPLVLRFGAVKTKPFPDRTRVKSPAVGRKVNVRRGPGTGYAKVKTLADGTLWVAYQRKDHWYGNQNGTLWIHDSGLTHEGGIS